MAGTAPLFTTAPRLKIMVSGKQLGFAVGLSINVSVDLQPVQIIGQFGAVSIEPTRYNVVTGTMQIIRLASTLKFDDYKAHFVANPGILGSDVGAKGINPVTGAETTDNLTGVSSIDSNNPVAQSGLIMHLDPRAVLLSSTFDMELKLKVPKTTGGPEALNAKLLGNTATLTEIEGVNWTAQFEDVSWMRITGCRITSRNINIASGQLVNEPVSFQGLLATSFNGTDELMQADV